MDPETETHTDAPDAPAPPETPAPPPAAPAESALDAINAGIAEGTPAPKAAPVEDDEEPAATPPAPAPTATPPADPAAPLVPEVVPPPVAPPAPVQPPDPINDPIPEHIKGRTRERMTSLISTIKESQAAADRYHGERDEILGMIQQTRASPEQYRDALGYLAAINSGDPQQIRAAISTVQAELQALAAMIGEPVAGVDLLQAHADLQAAVQAGDLSAEHANELAAARAMRTHQQQAGQRVSAETQAQAAVNHGKQALNQLEAQLQMDPQYAQKRQLLIPVLQPILAQLPPQQWAQAFQQAYQRCVVPAAPVHVPMQTSVANGTGAQPLAARTVNQPLRAQQPAGNTAKQPTTLLDAINAGIEEASRR